jgi:hypothetical protein
VQTEVQQLPDVAAQMTALGTGSDRRFTTVLVNTDDVVIASLTSEDVDEVLDQFNEFKFTAACFNVANMVTRPS